MSYRLQPDHYPGIKIIVNSKKGELTLQSFEPYSQSRSHLIEISVKGDKAIFPLSRIQECFSPCKRVAVGDKKSSKVSGGGGRGREFLHIESVIRESPKDERLVKIQIESKSVITTISDFQNALTELKQHRSEKLKETEII
jgi:hypothetical protein